MISLLSKIIVRMLAESGQIVEGDKELYEYGCFIVLSQGLFFSLSGLFGLLFGNAWESLVFYILFSVIRCYAGGYHAPNETLCTIFTSLALLISSIIIRILDEINLGTISIAIALVSGIVVFFVGPIDSSKKPLTDKELAYNRKKMRICVIAILFIAVCGVLTNAVGITYAAVTSVTLEGFLLIIETAGPSKYDL